MLAFTAIRCIALLRRFRGGHDSQGRPVGDASFAGLAPGGYTVVVRAAGDPLGHELPPVRRTTLVWDEVDG